MPDPSFWRTSARVDPNAAGTYVKKGLIIAGIRRLNNSKNGNPRHQVTFTDGTSEPTEVDANIGGLIENSEYQGVKLCVTFNSRGHIMDAAPMSKEK